MVQRDFCLLQGFLLLILPAQMQDQILRAEMWTGNLDQVDTDFLPFLQKSKDEFFMYSKFSISGQLLGAEHLNAIFSSNVFQ